MTEWFWTWVPVILLALVVAFGIWIAATGRASKPFCPEGTTPVFISKMWRCL